MQIPKQLPHIASQGNVNSFGHTATQLIQTEEPVSYVCAVCLVVLSLLDYQLSGTVGRGKLMPENTYLP